MAKVFEANDNFILENDYTRFTLSKTGELFGVWDKCKNREIRGEKTDFFALYAKDGSKIPVTAVRFRDGIFQITCACGTLEIAVTANDGYFVFTLNSTMPNGVEKAEIANANYSYDYTDKTCVGAVGVALSVSVNPVYFPDGKSLQTKGEIYTTAMQITPKYALVTVPLSILNQTLKTVCQTIDKNEGLRNTIGGPWGRDSRLNFGNYMIQWNASKAFIDKYLLTFTEMGVDQIDFHKGVGSFRQGDFKFYHCKDVHDFNQAVVKPLEEKGISAGLHTYSFYIDYDCDVIMSNPEAQKDLSILEVFTLKNGVSAADEFFPTEEDTRVLNPDYGFMQRNTQYMLIDEEIVKFTIADGGVQIAERGALGTKATAHQKGAKIKHLDGYYHGFAPVPGSKLFFEIARNTAKTFNEGGFKMIYLDALDGIRMHIPQGLNWYYAALFVLEVLKGCERDPLIEFSMYPPALWAARGRVGAWDTPYRSFKAWNTLHANEGKQFIDRGSAATMGWYNLFPTTEKYPGNEHTKYQHTDAVEHLGSLAVMYDFSMVYFVGLGDLKRLAGMRRNTALYRRYDDLRKAQYFTDDYLQKLREGKWEYHLVKKRGKWLFQEKHYAGEKFFDLSDETRNQATYKNPFGKQTPFIRIEALLSTHGENPVTLLDLDETKDLTEQSLTAVFDKPLDLTKNLAKKIRVKGNGKKGGKIAVRLHCATDSEKGYALYIIDTDFRGWREFILLEADNGERHDHGFEKDKGNYAIYRSGFNNDRVTSLEVLTEGDMTGVKASSILACEHRYDILKNPTVEIGDTKVVFECELKSSDFIEFDGKEAKVIDRYGNETPIWFNSNIVAKRGKFKAKLTAKSLNKLTMRAQLTLGFTGKVIR